MADDPPMPLNSYAEDTSCCGKRIARALWRGDLDDRDLWACPICGCEWKPRMMGPLRYWEPHPIILVFR